MAAHNELGKWGEEKAAEYLRSKGYIIRDRDWQYKHCDLDIVAIDEDVKTIVFVEVKTRSTDIFGRPEEAITLKKIDNVMKTANAYIRFYKLQNLEIRFDSISIISADKENFTLEHNKNVMEPIHRYIYSRKKAIAKRYNKPGQWKTGGWRTGGW